MPSQPSPRHFIISAIVGVFVGFLVGFLSESGAFGSAATAFVCSMLTFIILNRRWMAELLRRG